MPTHDAKKCGAFSLAQKSTDCIPMVFSTLKTQGLMSFEAADWIPSNSFFFLHLQTYLKYSHTEGQTSLPLHLTNCLGNLLA